MKNWRIKLMALAVLMVLAGTTAASAIPPGPGGDPYPDGHCPGTPRHDDHDVPVNVCKRVNNPHFAHVPLTTPCGSSPVQNNCEGCQACCNGRREQVIECTCGGNTACEQAATQDRQTCWGICISNYEGNGCVTPSENANP